uniref:Uncharacterized protein n=1 Tax=Timema shepardi TaxID=629360 RepID=A0A7R9G401_TIMSH|nr:unnamed protein product [Timema shepardi]
MENHLGKTTPSSPTEIRTSISPSLAVELNMTSALANYATEAERWKETRVSLLNYPDSGVKLLNYPDRGVKLLNYPYSGVKLLNYPDRGVKLLNYPDSGVKLLNYPYSGVKLLNYPYSGVKLLNYPSVLLPAQRVFPGRGAGAMAVTSMGIPQLVWIWGRFLVSGGIPPLLIILSMGARGGYLLLLLIIEAGRALVSVIRAKRSNPSSNFSNGSLGVDRKKLYAQPVPRNELSVGSKSLSGCRDEGSMLSSY